MLHPGGGQQHPQSRKLLTATELLAFRQWLIDGSPRVPLQSNRDFHPT
jgi:hypothetical protein